MRVGVADHLGWAVVVTADDEHEVADRRRVALVEDGVPVMPVHGHHGDALDDDALAALVDEVRASAARATAAALVDLEAALSAPVRTLALRDWPPASPTEIAVLRRAPWEARADAVMYRQVLAAAAAARGWTVTRYDARDVVERAAGVLGDRAEEVLHSPRARWGPPWTKDHRVALAATVLDAAEARA